MFFKGFSGFCSVLWRFLKRFSGFVRFWRLLLISGVLGRMFSIVFELISGLGLVRLGWF